MNARSRTYRNDRAPGAWYRRGGEHPGLPETPGRPILGRLVVLVLGAFGRLPLGGLQRVGGALAWLGSLMPLRLRRVSGINLRIAFPELPSEARSRLMRRSIVETGRTFAEIGSVWSWDRRRIDRYVRTVIGEGLLSDAMRSGRGVVLAAPHLGNWEVVGMYCSSRYPMTTLYRRPRARGLDGYVRESRSRFGATMVPAGPGAARPLLRALSRGGLVAILPDQDAGEGAGVFVPFFGELANTMVLLPRLAARTGALVVLGFAERLPRGAGFIIHFVPASEAIHDPDLARAAQAMNEDIEKLIRRRPEQYLWSYKRFRIRPPGSKDPYRRGI